MAVSVKESKPDSLEIVDVEADMVIWVVLVIVMVLWRWVVESEGLEEASAAELLPLAGLTSVAELAGPEDAGGEALPGVNSGGLLADAEPLVPVDGLDSPLLEAGALSAGPEEAGPVGLLDMVADEVPMVTVEVQLFVMVGRTPEVPAGPVVSGLTSVPLVGGRMPESEIVVVTEKADVVTDVRVSGQIVVDRGTTEV